MSFTPTLIQLSPEWDHDIYLPSQITLSLSISTPLRETEIHTNNNNDNDITKNDAANADADDKGKVDQEGHRNQSEGKRAPVISLEFNNTQYIGTEHHGMYLLSPTPSLSSLQSSLSPASTTSDDHSSQTEHHYHFYKQQQQQQQQQSFILLLRSAVGWRAHFISKRDWSIWMMINLTPSPRPFFGLQGLRSPTLFLDTVCAVLSTLLYNQLSSFHSLPFSFSSSPQQQNNNSVSLLYSPLFRNGLHASIKSHITSELVQGECHLTGFEELLHNPTLDSTSLKATTVTPKRKSVTEMACELNFGKMLSSLFSFTRVTLPPPTSSSSSTTTTCTEHGNNDHLSKGMVQTILTDQDIEVFKQVKMPRLLSASHSKSSLIIGIYHVLIRTLCYHTYGIHSSEHGNDANSDIGKWNGWLIRVL